MKLIDEVRITHLARYRMPWWRRLLMRVIGRSHLSKVTYPEDTP